MQHLCSRRLENGFWFRSTRRCCADKKKPYAWPHASGAGGRGVAAIARGPPLAAPPAPRGGASAGRPWPCRTERLPQNRPGRRVAMPEELRRRHRCRWTWYQVTTSYEVNALTTAPAAPTTTTPPTNWAPHLLTATTRTRAIMQSKTHQEPDCSAIWLHRCISLAGLGPLAGDMCSF
jgi:hypothetical protein